MYITVYLLSGLPLFRASLVHTVRPPALTGFRVHVDPCSGPPPEISAELARVTAERTRLQRQAQKERARRRKQREHAFLTATIVFCLEPTARSTIAEATLRKYARVMDENVATCTHGIEVRFLETPVDALAQWHDWSGDIPRTVRTKTQRLVEAARLLHWIGTQNSAQSVAAPPPFVRGEKNGAPWP